MKPYKQELWKPVVGFEGCYEVSNLGKVKSLRRTKNNNGFAQNVYERILAQAQTNYPSVSLWLDGVLTVKKVHRIVAEAWIPNPENKPEVNHIDANRQNNCIDNLEWVTRQENCTHAKVNKLMPSGKNHVKTKVDASDVFAYWARNKDLTHQQIANNFGISQSRVCQIVGGK